MNDTSAVSPVRYEDRSATFAHQARGMVLHHGEKILTEIPTMLRRIGVLMLVLSISVPVFLVGLLVVLWRLG